MTSPDGMLVACPSCSAWPMPVRVRTPVGDESRASFKCVKCGHNEGGVSGVVQSVLRND
jgi:hypothetical protein